MSASATIELEVKFVTPNNDLFYSASVYQPLRSQEEEIRLLRLLPGQCSDQLQCEIEDNVSLLEHSHKYHALSYCAGDATVVETIKVHNVDFNIFSNLGAGLRRIRKTDESLLIWVDQICINQKNVSEREQQVLMMRSIYANASKTILWLGENQKSECLAVSFLQHLCDRARTAQVSEYGEQQNALSKLFQIMKEQNPEMDILPDTPSNPSSRSLVFNVKLILDQSKILSNEVKDGKYGEELAATGALYQMPWWKRFWVLQETIVSKAADVLYGSSTIGFDDLRLANAILTLAYREQFGSLRPDLKEHESVRGFTLLSQPTTTNILVGLEEKWKTRPNLPIREVLNVSRGLESTDPRDRVYAMLGLMDQKYKIIPSYSPSNTAAQTFTTAVKASIEYDGVLDILSDGHEQRRDSKLGLPSWVPDYTVAPAHFSMCNWEHDDGKSKFNASLQAGPGETPLIPGIPLPEFFPDKDGRVDRVLECVMLDLGSLALENTLGDVPDILSQNRENSVQSYYDLLTTAGMKDIHPSTLPEARDKSHPDQPLHVALMQTLGCGVLPSGEIVADLTPGNVEFGKTFFLDRFTEVYALGTWRFFITPNKAIGVAPAAARCDDTICILMGAKVPFVLRKISVENSRVGGNDYTLIGPVYLHGYMSGEAIVDIFKGRRKPDFTSINIH